MTDEWETCAWCIDARWFEWRPLSIRGLELSKLPQGSCVVWRRRSMTCLIRTCQVLTKLAKARHQPGHIKDRLMIGWLILHDICCMLYYVTGRIICHYYGHVRWFFPCFFVLTMFQSADTPDSPGSRHGNRAALSNSNPFWKTVTELARRIRNTNWLGVKWNFWLGRYVLSWKAASPPFEIGSDASSPQDTRINHPTGGSDTGLGQMIQILAIGHWLSHPWDHEYWTSTQHT